MEKGKIKLIKLEKRESFLNLEVSFEGNVYKGIVIMSGEEEENEKDNGVLSPKN